GQKIPFFRANRAAVHRRDAIFVSANTLSVIAMRLKAFQCDFFLHILLFRRGLLADSSDSRCPSQGTGT
ncbi:hypothetical protein, partial [uncultured Caballeronia sp.]|uniref:hypothetical protein n=1 Tax=uncultured Caballeronia sp. TaxID=1827198 RepID=UPI0035CADCAA